MPSIFDQRNTSQMLAQYDQERDRETVRNDRRAISQEHMRHNQVIEDLDAQRAAIAKMQTDARVASEQLKIKAAERQAKDIIGASKDLGGLDPESPTYEAKLASIRGTYPGAFIPSGNAANGTMLDFVSHLDKKNEEWQKAKQQSREQAIMFEREHGVKVPVDNNGDFDFEAAQSKLDQRMKDSAPSDMQQTEQTVSSTGTVTQKFGTGNVKIPPSTMNRYNALSGQIAGNEDAFKNATTDKEKNDLITGWKVLKAEQQGILEDYPTLKTPQPNVPPPDPSAQAPQTTAQAIAAPDMNALAQKALNDPAATDEHKAAARKILGIADPAPAPSIQPPADPDAAPEQ